MPYLILQNPDGTTKRFWNLEKKVTTVGRSVDVNAPVDDAEISRQHFSIEPSPDGKRYILKDLGSRNGTRVNGQPVTEHALNSNDTIQAGQSNFLLMDGLTTISVKLDEARKSLGRVVPPRKDQPPT